MRLPLRWLSVLSVLLASAAVAVDKLRLDANGDPLPDGALARLGTAPFRGSFQGVALSPDGRILAVGDEQSLRLLEVATGKTIRTIETKRTDFDALSFSPDGKLLARTGYGSGIQLFEVNSGRPVRQVGADGNSRVGAVVFSADSRTMSSSVDYSGRKPPSIRIWESATGKEMAIEPLQNDSLRVALCGDGRHWLPGASTVAAATTPKRRCAARAPSSCGTPPPARS